ncbi:hypothetical protein [Chryseobacterium sp. CT-SW4]|uniref:hypothetical protein n=1 Tax=Chryseobacterium sp. SW-1 TaxID=3157343 RepID=UPI003B01150E
MKKFILGSIVLGIHNLYAQVGISTTSPQQTLHIAGTSSSSVIEGTSVQIVRPTLRTDGLNNTNQSIEDKLRPVSVTNQGDIILSHPLVRPLVLIDFINTANGEKDYIPSAVTINQTASSTRTQLPIRSFNFTLPSPSIVKFNVVTSFQFFNALDGNIITDGSNRAWGTILRFSQAPSGISTAQNSVFGESIRSYNNVVANTGASGIFYTTSNDTLYLPQGNYTLDINLFAETAPTQNPLRISYGGGNDTVSIIAYSLQ